MINKPTVALSEANIVLAISQENVLKQVERVLERFSAYFNISREAIEYSCTATTAIFFIRSNKDAYRINWFNNTPGSFAASAYPVIEENILKNRGGESLNKLVKLTESRGGIPELWKMNPPFCFFHQDKVADKIECFNDFLGFGRLYEYSIDDIAIVSSSAIALALVMPAAVQLEENFWNAYLTFGGGLGDFTFFKDITLVQPGHKLEISHGKIYKIDLIGYKKLIKLQRSQDFDAGDPIEAALHTLKIVKPFMPEEINIGLSGGRDSRLIAALAFNAGIKFKTFTVIPPEMEAEVAENLIEALPDKIAHERRFARTSQTPKQPILQRADSWFNYLGGDCWSTYTRKDLNALQKSYPTVPTLSGATGEVGRGVYYKQSDIANDPTIRIQQMMSSALRQRIFVPQYMKVNAVHQYKASLFEPLLEGIEGFQLLDYAFAMNRVRRHFPASHGSVTPLFTPSMGISRFWDDPLYKTTAKHIIDSTARLVPEWKNIPYMNELVKGTDPNKTNKTMTALMHWESNRDDFYDSIDKVIDKLPELELTKAKVENIIEECVEGRPRTNHTFELFFWKLTALEIAEKIQKIKSAIQ